MSANRCGYCGVVSMTTTCLKCGRYTVEFDEPMSPDAQARSQEDGLRKSMNAWVDSVISELDGLRDELRVAEGDAAEWKRRYDELVATRVPMERVEGGAGLWREVRP